MNVFLLFHRTAAWFAISLTAPHYVHCDSQRLTTAQKDPSQYGMCCVRVTWLIQACMSCSPQTETSAKGLARLERTE